MNNVITIPKLDAYQTNAGNYFVVFHEYYGAYFNSDLTDFMSENPVRVEVKKEESWIEKTWGENSKMISLTAEQSSKLIILVKKNHELGLSNIQEKVLETYEAEGE